MIFFRKPIFILKNKKRYIFLSTILKKKGVIRRVDSILSIPDCVSNKDAFNCFMKKMGEKNAVY